MSTPSEPEYEGEDLEEINRELAGYVTSLTCDLANMTTRALRWRGECIEARRVARSVARMWMTFLLNGTLPDPAPDVDTALAYPEPEGAGQSQAASSATPA